MSIENNTPFFYTYTALIVFKVNMEKFISEEEKISEFKNVFRK